MENIDGPDSQTVGQSLSTVVETVQSPESAESFPGLYVWGDAFIADPFIGELCDLPKFIILITNCIVPSSC